TADDREILLALDPQSIICVPLKAHERTCGVMTLVLSGESRQYSRADLDVAEDLARRAAIALENARLYGEAREADRRKDEFLAMLAHELRNPLAPIRNALQMVGLRKDDPATVTRAHALMVRQVDQLVRLVDALLAVSRITRGRIRLKRQVLELAPLVRNAVESCQSLIDARRHRVEVFLPVEPILLDADPARLEQVLTNLLNNAAKYTED